MTEGNREIRELPKGWSKIKLGEVVEFEYGKSLTKSLRYESGAFPVFGSSGIVGYHNEYLVEAPVLIIGRKGAVGEVWFSEKNCWAIDTTYFVRVSGFLSTKFIFFLLKSLRLRQYDKSTAIPGLNRNDAYRLSIELPPFAEQQRIVEKIEELCSELDQGIENLKTAQKQLKVYRQAVLKWAFEGKLTEKWRSQIQQEKLDIKTGEELLSQIKAERENRYQQQLAEWEEAVREWGAIGKSGKKPTKPQKLKKISYLTKTELSDLSHLPAKWYWVKIGDLTTGVEYGSATKSKKEGRVPVLRMGNIQNCVFDWSDLVFSDEEQEIEKYLLKKGDVLFNRTNSPELVGKTAIYQDERPAIFAGYLIKINQINELVLSKYLNYFLNSIIAKKHGNKVKTDGVNQSNINGDKLANYPFPYTSLKEQDQIVQEIELRLSICDQLENTIIENLQKAEALRQSILKQAFEGKLVPQDPNDEPAEKLLERIKQEKIKVKKGEQLSIQSI